MHAQDWFLAFLAIILPPIPVVVKRGFCSAERKLKPFSPPYCCQSMSEIVIFKFLLFLLLIQLLVVIISILLLILGFLPSLIYAWYIISKYPKVEYLNIPDSEGQYGSV